MARNKIITHLKDKGWNLNTLTNVLKSIVKGETLDLKGNFQGTCLVMFFLECVNMPLLMKKFVRTWNMCLLNLLKHICKNALLGQILHYLVKVIKNGTKIFIKVSFKLKKLNVPMKTRLVMFFVILLWFHFCNLFLGFINCKLFCWSLIYFCKFASKIILFQEALQFKVTNFLYYSQ
jgi:hypothetical protein